MKSLKTVNTQKNTLRTSKKELSVTTITLGFFITVGVLATVINYLFA